MGLFSKKVCICQQCGREYEARVSLGTNICPICKEKLKDARKEAEGYAQYASMLGKKCGEEELRAMAKHRDSILEKYRNLDSITKEELKEAGDHYKKLSEEEAISIYTRAMNSSLFSARGAHFSNHFFCLTSFEDVVVDSEDIFAVGYITDSGLSTNNMEAILCAVFTNDPYVPAFPVVHAGQIGFFAISKSKTGRQRVETIYNGLCPNLSYPVMSLKDLKKTVKKEGSGGKLDASSMLNFISDASSASGIFNTKYIVNELPDVVSDKLASYGYISNEETERLLKLNKVFAGTFWEDIARKSKGLNF